MKRTIAAVLWSTWLVLPACAGTDTVVPVEPVVPIAVPTTAPDPKLIPEAHPCTGDIAGRLLGTDTADDPTYVRVVSGSNVRLRPQLDAPPFDEDPYLSPLVAEVLGVCDDDQYRVMFTSPELEIAAYVGFDSLGAVLLDDTDVQLPNSDASLQLRSAEPVDSTPGSDGLTVIRAEVDSGGATYAAWGLVPIAAVGYEHRPRISRTASAAAGTLTDTDEFTMYASPGEGPFLKATGFPVVRVLAPRKRGFRLVEIARSEISATGWVRETDLTLAPLDEFGIDPGLMGTGVSTYEYDTILLKAGAVMYDGPEGSAIGVVRRPLSARYKHADKVFEWPEGWIETPIGTALIAVKTEDVSW
jgi:hypothetical protein